MENEGVGVRLAFGSGGWVGVEATNVPGRLYLRMAPDAGGRLKARELYLDAEADLAAAHLRTLPLGMLEGLINEERHQVLQRLDAPSAAAGIRALARHHGSTFGRQAKHWVAEAWRAQIPGERRPQPPAKGEVELTIGTVVLPESKEDRPRLQKPTSREGFDDAFYAAVAKTYSWLTSRGMAPAPVIAADTATPVGTVHRWVREARRRGHLAPGAKGRAG